MDCKKQFKNSEDYTRGPVMKYEGIILDCPYCKINTYVRKYGNVKLKSCTKPAFKCYRCNRTFYESFSYLEKMKIPFKSWSEYSNWFYENHPELLDRTLIENEDLT